MAITEPSTLSTGHPGRTAAQTPPAKDLVTVVVPAYNEEANIGPCLQSIQRQTYTTIEIIVVDGGSTDRTVDVVGEMARHDLRIRVVFNRERLIPISLNRAVAAANGRWLVRVDAHAAIPTDYVANAVRLLRTGRWGGVGGRKDGTGASEWGRAIAAAMSSPFGVGNSYYHYGDEPREVDHVPFGAYPLDVIRDVGGWDPALAVNQDFEFDHRVRQSGRRILFDPSLRVEWQSRQTIPDLFRQYRRYGKGKFTVMRKHPGSARLRQLAGPALVAALVTGSALATLGVALAAGGGVLPATGGVLAAIPLVGLSIAYAGFLAVGALQQRQRRSVSAPRTALAFAAMHLGHGIGFWAGALRAAGGRT